MTIGEVEPVDWAQRQSLIRNLEWEAALALLDACRQLLGRFLADPEKLRPADLLKMVEIASRLGRLATGLTTETLETTSPGAGPGQAELESALDKVYGPVGPSLETEGGK